MDDTEHSEHCGLGGVALGTCLDTVDGARRVEDLRPGDLVMTADHGPQPLIACLPAGPGLVVFPLGADLGLAPGQHLLLRDAVIQLHTGLEACLARAADLAPALPIPTRFLAPVFGGHQIIRANGHHVDSLFVTADLARRVLRCGGPTLPVHTRAARATLHPDEAAIWRLHGARRPRAA